MTNPRADHQIADTDASAADAELDAEQLQQVSGGLLLPAVQKVREAAARAQPTETVSLNFAKP